MSKATKVASLGRTLNSSSVGNLNFPELGSRITGDMSNATIANRVAFQSSTANSTTSIGILPNGTSVASNIRTYNNSDATNAAYAAMSVDSSVTAIASGIIGTGTYLPMTFYTGGSERVRLDSSGNVGIGTSSPSGKLHLNNASIAATYMYMSNSFGTGAIGAGGGNQLDIAQTTNGPIVFYTGGSEKLRLDSTGRLVIGNAGTSVIAYSFGGQELQTGIGCPANGAMAFYAGSATERARFDASGNFLVGSGNGGGRINATNSVGQWCYLTYAANQSGTYYHIVFTDVGTSHGSITSNGTNVSYNTTSD
jgi:hypothetical protein